MSKTILVTGANGQLGSCLKDIQTLYPEWAFIFTDSTQLNIIKKEQVDRFFKDHSIDWCINCAAYTAVDKAETDKDQACDINVLGAKHLATACANHQVKLIHVSTDFVFDGNHSRPYSEEDQTNPIGVYGNTKQKGEIEVRQALNECIIIRTSWLYSEHGHNFLKTMMKLGAEREELNVVGDQIGTPTYAGDLAKVLLEMVRKDFTAFGIYHFSNEGVASWYDFAQAIFDITGNHTIKVCNIPSESFPTPAKRPSFSVLDKTKIKTQMNIEIPYWRDSLHQAINRIK